MCPGHHVTNSTRVSHQPSPHAPDHCSADLTKYKIPPSPSPVIEISKAVLAAQPVNGRYDAIDCVDNRQRINLYFGFSFPLRGATYCVSVVSSLTSSRHRVTEAPTQHHHTTTRIKFRCSQRHRSPDAVLSRGQERRNGKDKDTATKVEVDGRPGQNRPEVADQVAGDPVGKARRKKRVRKSGW